MLSEEESKDTSSDISQANADDYVFYVGNDPVMQNAVNLIQRIGKTKNLILKAKGHSIPNAVAIANILTEKMLKDSSKIQKIVLDSEIPKGMGRMLSTIEIVISKN